jgi:hypothetical protein
VVLQDHIQDILVLQLLVDLVVEAEVQDLQPIHKVVELKVVVEQVSYL